MLKASNNSQTGNENKTRDYTESPQQNDDENLIQRFIRWLLGGRMKDEVDNDENESQSPKTPINEEEQLEKGIPASINFKGLTKTLGKDHNLGQLHFALRYYIQRDILKIFLQKGTLLRAINPDAKIRSYVQINFEPNFKTFKSSFGKGERDSIWHEVFVFTKFSNSRLKYSKLTLTVYHQASSVSQSQILGVVNFDLDKLYAPLLPENASKENCSHESHYSLEIDDCACRGTTLNRYKLDTPHEEYTIQDWVNDTDPDMEPTDGPDYPDCCVSSLTENDERELDDSASIRASDEYKAKMRKLAQKETVQIKKHIKEAEKLNIRRYANKQGCLLKADNFNSFNEEEEQRDDSLPQLERSPLVRKLNVIRNISPFQNTRPHFGDIMIGFSYHAASYTLIMEIVKGRELRDEKGSTMNLYVSMHSEILKGRRRFTKPLNTPVVNGGVDPVFNFPAHFIVPHGDPGALGISVKVICVRSMQPNRVLGHLRFSLSGYPIQKEHWKSTFETSPNRVYRWHSVQL